MSRIASLVEHAVDSWKAPRTEHRWKALVDSSYALSAVGASS
ncbi:hypothetical protein [Nocardia sp. NPDC003183]